MFRYFLIGLITLGILGAYFFYPTLKEVLPGVLPILKPPPEIPRGEPLPFTLPEGFIASLYSGDTPGARDLIRDPKGTLLVSLTREGKVVALPDVDVNGVADEVVTILENLNGPHGLAFFCPDTGNVSADEDACDLYAAEENAVKEYAYDADTYRATYTKTLVTLPSGAGHSTRSLLFHPDSQHLLVSVGSSCNVCNEADERRASVLSVDRATGEYTIFARGLRNTVFMALHPVTGEIWGTDMGRDWLGDDLPPDEVNVLGRPSASQNSVPNFGWPVCYGKNIHDTEFDQNTYVRAPCTEPFESGALIDIPAHSAPLGIAFMPENGWPGEYRFNTLVAFHGSWNRSVPTGYKLVRFPIDGRGNPLEPVDFMTGFVREGEVIGRPVDILVENGQMFVSDDRAGAIYRITYAK